MVKWPRNVELAIGKTPLQRLLTRIAKFGKIPLCSDLLFFVIMPIIMMDCFWDKV